MAKGIRSGTLLETSDNSAAGEILKQRNVASKGETKVTEGKEGSGLATRADEALYADEKGSDSLSLWDLIKLSRPGWYIVNVWLYLAPTQTNWGMLTMLYCWFFFLLW